jgi:hypothetical protein
MSQISFISSARRLHSDADYLASDVSGKRNVNAGHLFGLAAECGLKYLLLLCGTLNRDPVTGDLVGRKKPHVNELVDPSGLSQNYQQAIAGLTQSRYFAQMPSLPALSSWKPSFRYYDDSDPSYPKANESGWQSASQEIQTALDAAILDGHPLY